MSAPEIVLDAGHGGPDSGAVGNGLREADLVLAQAQQLRAILLSRYVVQVTMTRDSDVGVSLEQRVKLANSRPAVGYVSLHVNAFHTSAPDGVETFASTNAPAISVERAGVFHRHVAPVWTRMGRVDRGLKRAGFYVIRKTKMSALLVENGFITNARDAQLLGDPGFQRALCEAMADGIAEAWGLSRKTGGGGGTQPVGDTPILGKPQATVGQARKWARDRGAHQRFVDIADTYWQYGQQIGIRPEVAYSQAAKETAFGRYGGVVKPEQNNWAGIKTADASGDRPEDHETFASPEDGVRAHYNHLAAYTGRDPIGEPHGRYHVVKTIDWAGTVRYVEELGGKWAPNPDYGRSIVRDFLAGLLNTEAPPQDSDPDYAGHWAEKHITWVLERGLMAGYPDGTFRPDQPLTRAEMAVILKRLQYGGE